MFRTYLFHPSPLTLLLIMADRLILPEFPIAQMRFLRARLSLSDRMRNIAHTRVMITKRMSQAEFIKIDRSGVKVSEFP